jgi:hypothetical protein
LDGLVAEPAAGYHSPVGEGVGIRSGCGNEPGRDKRGDAGSVARFSACGDGREAKVAMSEFRCTGKQAGTEAATAEPRS